MFSLFASDIRAEQASAEIDCFSGAQIWPFAPSVVAQNKLDLGAEMTL